MIFVGKNIINIFCFRWVYFKWWRR